MAPTLNWLQGYSPSRGFFLGDLSFRFLYLLTMDRRDAAYLIQPLPPLVAAQIKSSSAIPSLASVVLGLIANSLDARAQKIYVTVDFSRGATSVEDDGIGIPPNEFCESGGLGRLHCEERRRRSGVSVTNGV